MEKLKIVSRKEVKPVDPNAGSYFEVKMSDGSEWICDQNGENWKPFQGKLEKPDFTDDSLLKKFLNR